MKTQDAVERFIHNRQALNLSMVTIKWYEEKLGRFARFCSELPTEPEPIESFLGTINGVPETRHAYFRILRAFYRFASVRFDFRNPTDSMRAPTRPKKIMPTLEPHEMMKLLNITENLRDRTLLTLLVDTGTRAGEIVGLRSQDIRDDSIKVRGKTGESEIPISDETRRLLLALISANGKSEFIFTGHKGPITRHLIYAIVRRHMEQAGIKGPKLGPHRIRHAFGKNYLVNGGDLRSLQQIMGHADITTTQKYASLNLSDVISKHNKFTPLRAVHAAAQESFPLTTA